jgi:hypothetical protein
MLLGEEMTTIREDILQKIAELKEEIAAIRSRRPLGPKYAQKAKQLMYWKNRLRMTNKSNRNR